MAGAVSALLATLIVAVPPAALADNVQQFNDDIAHWNSIGGQIPGDSPDWLKAANTVCEGIGELESSGASALSAFDAQVQAAVAGGWLKRDAGYFVMHSINSFCPQFRPQG